MSDFGRGMSVSSGNLQGQSRRPMKWERVKGIVLRTTCTRCKSSHHWLRRVRRSTIQLHHTHRTRRSCTPETGTTVDCLAVPPRTDKPSCIRTETPFPNLDCSPFCIDPPRRTGDSPGLAQRDVQRNQSRLAVFRYVLSMFRCFSTWQTAAEQSNATERRASRKFVIGVHSRRPLIASVMRTSIHIGNVRLSRT